MFNRIFIRATVERAIKTWAQSAGALLVGDGAGLLTVDWVDVLSVSGLAAVISVLTSIGSYTVGNDGPSLISAEQLSE